MKHKSAMIILFILGFSYPREYTRGVVQTIEASFCMDFCSMYYLEPDSGFMATNLTTIPIIILEEYVGQHVEIWGEQTWCVECGALDVDEIILIQNTPPECTDNTNCGDCFDAGCFWQPVASVGYQCNDECFIMDTACYGQGAGWVAECPETEDPNCCDAAELAEENCGGLGCFIPQCTEDCEWEPMQCWSSTGYCWCVDEEGNEIADRVGYVRVSKTGNNVDDPSAFTYSSQLLGDRQDIGGVVMEHPVLGLDARVRVGMVTGLNIPKASST